MKKEGDERVFMLFSQLQREALTWGRKAKSILINNEDLCLKEWKMFRTVVPTVIWMIKLHNSQQGMVIILYCNMVYMNYLN